MIYDLAMIYNREIRRDLKEKYKTSTRMNEITKEKLEKEIRW